MSKGSQDFSMTVQASTWPRDSHGLYDYETTLAVRSDFHISGPGNIVRMGNECFFQTQPALGAVVLAEVANCKGRMTIRAVDTNTDWSSLWVSVRSLREANGYKLAQGDYIRIGRVQFRVKQMSVEPPTSDQVDFIDKKGHAHVNSSFICSPSGSRSQQAGCRICLQEESDNENPLICPCKCSGTMKYIHLFCLREWLKNRMKTRQTGHSVSYFWKSMSCELCKETLPNSVTVKDRYIELMGIPKPETPFLLLEDISREDRESRGLHMISMLANSEIRVGRGQESDVRIDDISVSRNHAVIKMKDRSFCIEDSRSKFGTLILARRPLVLNKGISLTVQVNRTLLSLSVKKPWNGFKGIFGALCCGRPTIKVVDAAFLYRTEEGQDIQSDISNSVNEMSGEYNEEGTLEVHGISNTVNREHLVVEHEDSNLPEEPIHAVDL